MTVQKWAIRLFGFITIAVLTRVLPPEDFGTVAAASTVLPFFLLVTDLGFAAYIVQAEKVDDRMLSTGFWFSSLAGLTMCGALIALAPVLGAAFGPGQVTQVLQVLSLSLVFTGIGSVPSALLRRGMRFRTLATQGAAAAVLGQVVAIVLALSGLGVWALVGQTLTASLTQAVLAWVAAHWRPVFAFSRADFVTMARFGSQVLGVEFVAMARAWAEAAIVSAALGLSGLGYLNIAQRLVQVVQDLTGSALVPVTTVAFARIRDSLPRLREAYLRALRMTYVLLTPPLTLVAIAAPILIPIVFGDGWAPSYQVTQALALAGIMVVAATLDHGLHYGLGRPGQWFVYALVVDLATVGATALTAPSGLLAIGLGFLVVATLATMVRWLLVGRLLESSPRVIAGPFGFLTVAVVASGALGLLVLNATSSLPPLVQVALTGVTVLLVHLIVVRLLARQAIDEVLRYLHRFGWAQRIPLLPKPKEQS